MALSEKTPLIGSFQVLAQDGHARCAKLLTARGEITTPVFMPVGTKATVKAMFPEELKALGAQIVLGNTYHLHLRPGEQIIKNLGGLHKFMNWDGPILTDSGGFQVFSLSSLRKITDEGVEFRSHLDGSSCFLSPEKSMQIQMDLGADIIMAFDECPPFPADKSEILQAMKRTKQWLGRCVKSMTRKESLLFGIVQGGMDLELRKQSLEEINEFDLPGTAMGGFSVGEPIHMMHELVGELASQMPAHKPRYLMGVGTPTDLVLSIDAGVDMFDCVMPTRVARNGTLFTWQGKVSIKRKQYQTDSSPLDEECSCYTCKNYSKAYLRHVFLSGEIISSRLNTLHNLHFYMELMAKARQAICEGRWDSFKRDCLTRFCKNDSST